MKPFHVDVRARVAAALMALSLVACGGDDERLMSGPRQVNPAVSALLDSVDAIGPGGAGLLWPRAAPSARTSTSRSRSPRSNRRPMPRCW